MTYDPFDFTRLPLDICDSMPLPDFPAIQDCNAYTQLRSEIGGIIIRPLTALSAPTQWYNFSQWESTRINNEDPDAAHYITGRGSFLQSEKETVVLAGGRIEENRERTQRLVFQVTNLSDGHTEFGRKLQSNKRNFFFWLHTVDNRVIGGASGMVPVLTDTEFVLAQGRDSRQTMNIIIDTEFLWFPKW